MNELDIQKKKQALDNWGGIKRNPCQRLVRNGDS